MDGFDNRKLKTARNYFTPSNYVIALTAMKYVRMQKVG